MVQVIIEEMMKKKSGFVVIVLLLTILVISMAVCVLSGPFLIKAVKEAPKVLTTSRARVTEQANYGNLTDPLGESVINHLCVEFEIPPSDLRCKNGIKVYGPDFFDDIEAYVEKISDNSLAEQIIREKLKDFEVNCSTLSDDVFGTDYYRCDYDLAGDNMFLIIVWFLKDGRIERIRDSRGGS